MARLVAVSHSDYQFERRQIPLVVDDNLTMVVQFNDSCEECDQAGVNKKDLDRFVQRFHALTNDEVAVALMVTSKDIFSLLQQMVLCVGCRRSVEELFAQLVESGHPALEPLIITSGSILSIRREYLFDPRSMYALFYVHGSRLNTIMESIPKSKKNRRCVLHSLDSHKQKSLGWMDIWEVLSQDCRDEVVLIECDTLMDTLENYLRKHRFCSECKSKVLRAYNILIGELDHTTEKGYCAQLYDGLRCCPGERHVHVRCETDFIAHLIGRAEPELTGRRERHAKTLDIAQEEVLTCLGIHLYERLHKIWQKLRAEEQTWEILFYLGVHALRQNFEVALEKKQGISNLELMCQELLEEEQAREMKREQKRQKKKKKKNKSKTEQEAESEKNKENCTCDSNTSVKKPAVVNLSCGNCDDNHNVTRVSSNTRPARPCQGKGGTTNEPKPNPNPNTAKTRAAAAEDTGHPGNCADKPMKNGQFGRGNHGNPGNQGDCHENGVSSRSDYGYSSGPDGCDTCSMPSSNDGSDIACSEGLCNHEGDSPMCARSDLNELLHDCLNSTRNGHSPLHEQPGTKWKESPGIGDSTPVHTCREKRIQPTLSLQDMLEAYGSSGEEDAITEEEIQEFKANQKIMNSKRVELRAMLKQRFDNLHERSCTGCETAKCAVKETLKVANAKVSHVEDVTSRVTKLSVN